MNVLLLRIGLIGYFLVLIQFAMFLVVYVLRVVGVIGVPDNYLLGLPFLIASFLIAGVLFVVKCPKCSQPFLLPPWRGGPEDGIPLKHLLKLLIGRPAICRSCGEHYNN